MLFNYTSDENGEEILNDLFGPHPLWLIMEKHSHFFILSLWTSDP